MKQNSLLVRSFHSSPFILHPSSFILPREGERAVPWSEIVAGSFLILALVGMSFYFGRRQLLTLRRLRQDGAVPDEERLYERKRARRRLISCGLTLLLAVLMVLLLALFEGKAQQLADAREGVADDAAPALTPAEKAFLRVWGGLVISILLLLLAVLGLAAVDLWETRRYGLRQMRKLQADRRAMIQRQAARLREPRDGNGQEQPGSG